jgi:hypothetical protein
VPYYSTLLATAEKEPAYGTGSHDRDPKIRATPATWAKSDTFDKAIATFSIAYADQNERDYGVLKKAAKACKLEVVVERQ